jgi:hypothetical protein
MPIGCSVGSTSAFPTPTSAARAAGFWIVLHAGPGNWADLAQGLDAGLNVVVLDAVDAIESLTAAISQRSGRRFRSPARCSVACRHATTRIAPRRRGDLCRRAHRGHPMRGADGRNRTGDLLITK